MDRGFSTITAGYGNFSNSKKHPGKGDVKIQIIDTKENVRIEGFPDTERLYDEY